MLRFVHTKTLDMGCKRALGRDARFPRAAGWTLRAACYSPSGRLIEVRRVLRAIFTWWNGGTFAAKFHIGRKGVKVGVDQFGNTYYEARDARDSYGTHKRRWVIYRGYADASKVPAEWHGWLHYT